MRRHPNQDQLDDLDALLLGDITRAVQPADPAVRELGRVALTLQTVAADGAGLDSEALWKRIALEIRAPRDQRAWRLTGEGWIESLARGARDRVWGSGHAVRTSLTRAAASVAIVGFALLGALLLQSGGAEAELLVAIRNLSVAATEAVEGDRLSPRELTVLEERTADLVGAVRGDPSALDELGASELASALETVTTVRTQVERASTSDMAVRLATTIDQLTDVSNRLRAAAAAPSDAQSTPVDRPAAPLDVPARDAEPTDRPIANDSSDPTLDLNSSQSADVDSRDAIALDGEPRLDTSSDTPLRDGERTADTTRDPVLEANSSDRADILSDDAPESADGSATPTASASDSDVDGTRDTADATTSDSTTRGATIERPR